MDGIGMHCRLRRVFGSIGIGVAWTLVLMRPWPGSTEPRAWWDMLATSLLCSLVFYRAWPTLERIRLRRAIPRVFPGLALGVGLAVLIPASLSRILGWDENLAGYVFLAGSFAVLIALVVSRLVRQRASSRFNPTT